MSLDGNDVLAALNQAFEYASEFPEAKQADALHAFMLGWLYAEGVDLS